MVFIKPEVLERERDDLGRRNLENVGQLADGDEFVDAHGLALALGLGRPLRLELLARYAIIEVTGVPVRRPGPVRSALIVRVMLADTASWSTAPRLPFLRRAPPMGNRHAGRRPLVLAPRRRGARAGRRRCDRPRWCERRAAGDGPRPRRAGDDRTGSRPVIGRVPRGRGRDARSRRLGVRWRRCCRLGRRWRRGDDAGRRGGRPVRQAVRARARPRPSLAPWMRPTTRRRRCVSSHRRSHASRRGDVECPSSRRPPRAPESRPRFRRWLSAAASAGGGSAARTRRRTGALASAGTGAAAGSSAATEPRRRRGGARRLLDARPLLALPAGAHARDLLVGQWTEMAANRHVHRAKEAHHLIAGYAELACHVVHTKLTHTVLLKSSHGARVHQRTNTLRQLTVHNSDRRRRFPPDCRAERARARRRHPSHPAGIQQRHHLLQTVPRRVGRHDREG